MAGNDSDQILIGANGQVYVADTDTPAPTSEVSSLDAGFTELGFTSEAGVTLTDGKTITDIPVWQSFYPARKIISERSSTVAFVLRQWSQDTIALALGGGTVTGGGGRYEKDAVVLVGFSGTDSFKLTIGGQESAAIVRGTNYTAAGIKTAIEGISGVTAEVTVENVTDDGFEVTFLEQADQGAMTVTSGSGVTGTVATLVAGAAPSGSHYVYSPPSPEFIDERSLIVDWQDGDKDYRLYVPRGLVTENVEANLTRTAAADLPITFGAVTDGDTDPYTLYTNDPSFA